MEAPSRLPLRRDPLFWTLWGSHLAAGGFLVFIAPKFVEVFIQVDVAMPKATVIMGWASIFAQQFPWIWILGALLLARGIARLPFTENQREWTKVLVVLGAAINIGTIVASVLLPLCGLLEGIDS